VNNTLRSTGDSLVLDLTARGGDVVAKIEQTGSRVGDSIVARSNKVADTFRENAETLANSLDRQNNGVRDMLAARLQAFADVFNRDGTNLSEKLARDSAALGDLIIRHIGEFDRTVKTYGGELVEKLSQRTQDVGASMRDYVDGFDQRVTSRTEEISSTLDQRLAKFEELMGGKVNSLAQTLSEGGKDAVAAIDKRIAEAGDTINKRGDDVATRIADKAAAIDTTLGARADEVASHLDSRIGRFEELLVGRAEEVTSKIESRTKAAADALNSSATSIIDRAGEAERSLTALSDSVGGSLKTLSTEVAASFLGKAEEITNTVTRQTSEMTTLLSDKSGGVLASIVEKGQQFADSVTQATEQAVKSIEDKGLAFSQTMLNNSEELARMINAAGETATGAVSSTMSELHNVAQTAIQQAKQTSAASVSEMLETHNMLRADSTALYERLREANILLQEVLTGAHQNMSVLENTMMMRVTDFVSAMKEVTEGTNTASESVAHTIGDFRETTARVVTDLGQLTIRFEQHGRELAKAIELIERSNIRTEDAVNERRVTLDSLISTLDIRTEDLDQRLKRFSALLDESLDAAGGRAREIARVVSESSVESAHVIADQFEAMREAAETERRATAESMRAVYEQSTGDSQMMLRQAAERFTEIMESMKQMSGEMQQQLETTREELRRGIMELPQETAAAAAQMRSELEATREELRRGILELPRETADSATQMRRVLVDQIEALAELNRIVARHGRSLEQSEPRRVSRPERAEAPQPAARPTAASYAPPARRTGTDTSAQVQANKGWLTDLLNRASRDEDELLGESRPAPAPAPVVSRPSDERTPRHSIESLDSLSVDIARMIDHDAAADLWDRYKRGERNVFTRRLYTLQGQKAFDEIRAKYRVDREFKQTVDRYIAEFERLLEDVSRDDRGQVVARTYLTSETGKVYTMLAHAAGRFDQAQ
jgi:hypothetical protein